VTAGAGTPHVAAAPIPAIPLRRRLYGFGSIYGKTIRDSRLSFIIAAGLLGGMSLVMGAAIGTVFPTPAARHDLNALVGAMPASMVNLFGNATLMGDKLGTLGGYVTWKYGSTFAVGISLWSILALSGTLAGEAARGSLDLVAVLPFGKRRIALEKLAAHLTVFWITMAILAVALVVSSNAFGEAAMGDQLSLVNTVGFALWVGFIGMCFGGLAFALSPILGRGGSAAVAGIAMVALWVMSGLNVGGPLVNLSPFHWTADHVPLVGIYDWAGLALVGIVAVVFLAAGVVLFDRRDLGVTAGLSLPSLPDSVLGVRGPLTRAFGDQLPRVLSWGLGMAIWGALLGSLVGSFSELIAKTPDMANVFGQIFPDFDFSTAGGWLQLYVEIFFIAAGFAATTFVAKWASDETEGRLETLLATPMTRTRWVVAGGVAAVIGALLMALLFALGTALGAAAGGSTAGDALLGSMSLGLYAAAVVGIGVAIGGLWRTSLAAEIAALYVVATFLLDLLAPPLGLPDWVHQLALTAHVGQPMIGHWDPAGIVLCVAIAVVGIGIGAIGIRRRDVAR
jgi:ABC-2 type transport system permease protein